MRRVSYGLLVLMLIGTMVLADSIDIFAKEVNANDATEENILTVNGQGSIKVKPDIAYINIGVEVFNEDAELAQQENAKTMDEVVKRIKEAGINEADIKTISYNIYKTKANYPIAGNKENLKEGYNVRNVVEITIRDISNVGEIIDISSKSGSNSINSIRFGISDEDEYYNKALEAAMDNAANKAERILGTFGANMGKPYSIAENSYGAPRAYTESMSLKSEMSDGFTTPVQSGELTVSANVMVKYKY